MQVPAQVEYERATSVSHALALLTKYGPEARILAGGHSLIPMMKLRLAQPEVLIDISGISDLRYIRRSNGALGIGALATHADLLRSQVAGEHFAILHDAERVIADPIVREWGTVGGSLCQADPSEDLSAAFAALKGTMVIAGLSPGGQVTTREVPAREFHAGPYETVVGPAEMLTEIRMLYSPGGATPLSTPRQGGKTPLSPPSPGEPAQTTGPGASEAAWLRTTPLSTPRAAQAAGLRFGSAYVKVMRRAGDWPVGAACAAVWIDKRGVIDNVGIGLTALGARNFVAAEAEEFLIDRPFVDGKAGDVMINEQACTEAGQIAAAHCNPVADQRGPEDYKRHLAGELTSRALRLAAARARRGGETL